MKKAKWLKLFLMIGTIALIFLLYYYVSMFWKGIHNLDLGQNIRYLGGKYSKDFKDFTDAGRYLSGEELIILGFSQISKSFTQMILISFGLGLAMSQFECNKDG